MAEQLLTIGRNPEELQRLSDLAFVHYNLQLQQFQSAMESDIVTEEIGVMDDWIVDETWMNLDFADHEGTIDEGGPSRFQAKKETL